MDSKDLRIGNYYNWTEENDGDLYQIGDSYSLYCIEDNFNYFKPIQLTQKFMLDLGFIIQKGIFGYEYHLNRFVIYTSENNNLCFCWDNNSKNIQYVHQLQNLYYALTGQELTLKQ